MSARVAVRLSAEADTGDATGALVRRAQRGDGAAFEALYRQHAGRVYALCLRMSGDAQHAAELTHDVFVHVWRKLNSFRGDARFTTWLQRVAVNFVLNAQKSDRRRLARVEPVEDPARLDRGAEDGPVAERIDLERAIAMLPPGARQVFVLHDVEGWRHRDIAERMGTAEGTVKAQLHRARRLLRERLSRAT